MEHIKSTALPKAENAFEPSILELRFDDLVGRAREHIVTAEQEELGLLLLEQKVDLIHAKAPRH